MFRQRGLIEKSPYHVHWRVLSVDTSTTQGSFTFHVSLTVRASAHAISKRPHSGGRVGQPDVCARAVRFAASIMATGLVFFVVFIAEPAFHKAPIDSKVAAALRLSLAWIAWISIAFSVLSGVTWLVLVAASMSGQPVADVFTQGTLWTVLSQTDFGNDWLDVRLSSVFSLACLFRSCRWRALNNFSLRRLR